jgi:hypothetical protein
MPYDEELGSRIQTMLTGRPGVVQKKMFGGVGFMLNGNMACGVHKEFLIARIGPANDQAALALPNVRPFDMTGHPMTGWVMVSAPGFASDTDLARWVEMSWEYALSLPPK